MKGYTIILISVLIAFTLIIRAQSEGDEGVKFHRSESIGKLVEKHKVINKNFPKTDGYRVQIFSVSGVNSRDRANKMRDDFLEKFPDDDVYIVYHSPSYKVRIGNFRTKLDALRHIQLLKKDYPFAFVVVDEIEFK